MTVAAARWSRSPYILGAATIVALIWFGSVALWLLENGVVKWRYAVVEGIASAYFFKRWSERKAQHRLFHFLLMGSFLIPFGLSFYQLSFRHLLPDSVSMDVRWYQFVGNMLFVFQLLFITLYSLLNRRAKSDKGKWRRDANRWLDAVFRSTERPPDDDKEKKDPPDAERSSASVNAKGGHQSA